MLTRDTSSMKTITLDVFQLSKNVYILYDKNTKEIYSLTFNFGGIRMMMNRTTGIIAFTTYMDHDKSYGYKSLHHIFKNKNNYKKIMTLKNEKQIKLERIKKNNIEYSQRYIIE